MDAWVKTIFGAIQYANTPQALVAFAIATITFIAHGWVKRGSRWKLADVPEKDRKYVIDALLKGYREIRWMIYSLVVAGFVGTFVWLTVLT